MDLGVLIEGLGVRLLGGCASSLEAVGTVRVCDVTEDSRTVVPGSLFVARGGLRADGKAHIAQAIELGAVAILTDSADVVVCGEGSRGVAVLYTPDALLACAVIAERFYGSPSKGVSLALVTGTNGKTTTTSLIWRMLNGVSRRCGLVGTVVVDDGAEVASASMTTPPSVELSRTLQVMADSGCVAAAIEASSHALDQRRVDALDISAAVFTNLSGDHLDYHKTMEAYLSAKARLFTLLRPGGTAIVNVDDPAGERVIASMGGRTDVRVLRCGTGLAGGGAECRVEVRGVTIDGMALALAGPWGLVEATVPMIGAYNAMNVLQAAAAAHAMMALATGELERGLARIVAPRGRLEPVSEDVDGVKVFVDYAHSDDSLTRMLEAVGPLVRGKLWVVFGCGGDRDRTKRPRMGQAAAVLADRAVLTSDNPRTEKPGAIIDDVLAGIDTGLRGKVTVQADRERAIRFAIENAQDGDVVVIAGKGHETEQILSDGAGGTYSIHFDDAEVARLALAARRPTAGVGKPRVVVGRSRTIGASRWGRV